MAELLRRGLANEGHAVTIAVDGVKGLEEAQTHTFDMILLDIMLPAVDGLKVGGD